MLTTLPKPRVAMPSSGDLRGRLLERPGISCVEDQVDALGGQCFGTRASQSPARRADDGGAASQSKIQWSMLSFRKNQVTLQKRNESLL